MNFSSIITGPHAGQERLWIIGDEMVHKTFQENYEKHASKENFYSTNHYEVTVAAGGTNSRTKSMLSRILNCITNIFNSQKVIPKWIVIILENDLIKSLSYTEFGATSAYGEVLRWLFEEVKKIHNEIRENVPFKVKKYEWPHIMYIEPTLHRAYSDNDMCKEFITSLNTVNATHDEAIVVKLQQNWKENDDTIFNEREHRFTIHGLQSFWRAIDNGIMYADNRVLRNHGKSLAEIFKQDGRPNIINYNIPMQSNQTRERDRDRPGHDRPAYGRQHHNYHSNDRRSYRTPPRDRPSFRSYPNGMRLPAPNRY